VLPGGAVGGVEEGKMPVLPVFPLFPLLPVLVLEEEPCVREPDDPDALSDDGEPLELQLANRTAEMAHKMTTAKRILHLRVRTVIPSSHNQA
jgi:hypothetical protein